MLLELFRNHKRWLMFIAMILVIPSFVVTGIYSYNRMISDDGAIAKVDDVSILPQQFDEAKRQQLETLRARLGEAFRSNMLESPEARVALLERIMNDRALAGETISEHVEVSEATAIELIKTLPGFQKDGKFSPELYQNFLSSRGMSDEYFVYTMRSDIARELLTSGITRSVIVPQTLAQGLYDMLNEKRDVAVFTISSADFVKDVSIAEDAAKKYWSDNQKLFELPDEIDLEYVVLTPALFADVKPSEEDIRTFYEQNPNRFRTGEERRASHILIDLSEGLDKAKAKADELYKKLQAKPEEFEKLAKENSADPGSAREGGDLGYFGRGVMTPAFEEAVFKGAKGEIMPPIQTEFGFHIVKITDVKDEHVKALDDVRDEIVRLYQEQESQKRFAEEAENFSNMVYEQSDTLAPVVEKYGIKLEEALAVTAEGPSDPALKKLINQHVVESLFADECLREKRNTQAIEVSPNTLVAARVKAFRPKHVQSFEEARSDIMATLTQNAALDKASEKGAEVLKSLRSGKSDAAKFGDVLKLSRGNPQGQSFELINAAMRVPAKELPAYVGVRTASGYQIAHVIKSEMPAPNENSVAANARELSSMYGPSDMTMYYDALRVKHEAVILNDEYKPSAVEAEKTEGKKQ